jgi:broad specificity phosphatase PhoE
MFLKEKNVQTVVLVSHGAVTKILAAELGGGSDARAALSGKPRVASWCAFEQEHDGDNFDGWRPLYRSWQHSTILGAEKQADAM